MSRPRGRLVIGGMSCRPGWLLQRKNEQFSCTASKQRYLAVFKEQDRIMLQVDEQ
jgi:hypothetical protein